MNLITVKKLAVMVEELVTELGQLRTLVPDPKLLEFLATAADLEGQYYQASLARDLAQRIRAWPLTPDQDMVE